MTAWQPGMRITAQRLNDFAPVALTSSVVTATGWSLTSFTARRAAGTVEWTVILSRTGATITGSATGNIADTLACALPGDCRPADLYVTIFETAGLACGAARVAANGQITLTTLDPGATITAGSSVQVSGAFATG